MQVFLEWKTQCRTKQADLDDITWKSSHPPCLKQLLAPGPILGQSMATENTSFFTPKKGSENRNGNFPGYVREIQVGEILYLMVKIDGTAQIPKR